jgi:hypothetical protein
MSDHDYTEAAGLLGVTESWLRLHTPRELPHIKYGGERGKGPVRFTDAHLDEIRKIFERRPSSGPSAPADAHPVSDIRPVQSRGRARAS